MTDDIRKELEEALKADQEKALNLAAAMEDLYKETWDDKPTTDR